MKRLLPVLLLPLFALSCQDAGEPVSPDFPLPRSGAQLKGDIIDIVDARDEDGNSRFAFGPSLTDRIKIEGAFDETAVTQVRVCQLSMADPQTCVETVWTSVEPAPVETQGGDSWFRVDWKLTESDSPILGGQDAPTYRVGVFIGEFQIGYVDLKFDENEVNQNVPVRYMVNEGALAEGLTACVTDGEIIDCDAELLEPGVETTIRVLAENGGLAAQATIRLPEDHDPLFFLLEHIENLSQLTDGFPYFASATLFDEFGEPFGGTILVDEFILCQAENVTISPFLEIRRIDNGETTILPSDPNTPECTQQFATNSAASSWGERLRGGVSRLAGVFLPQPLRALHGGLNTTGMLCCSEFDAVLVEEVAPISYGSEWDWSSADANNFGTGDAPFYTVGDFNICPHLDTSGGTGGSTVWPLAPSTAQEDWKTITLTKSFQVPASSTGVTGIKVHTYIDNDIRVVLNGTDITTTGFGFVGTPGQTTDTRTTVEATDLLQGLVPHEGCAAQATNSALPYSNTSLLYDETDDFVFTPVSSDVKFGNVNTLEIVARDRGTIGYLDVWVEVLGGS